MNFSYLFNPYQFLVRRHGNNRKRTRGRQFHYAPLPNGKTRKVLKDVL
jgi:hypothetical protein